MKKVGTIIDNLRKGGKAPERHSNPYLNEVLNLDEYLYTAHELKEKSSIFANSSRPLVLEIGCYMGKNVLEIAQQNPHLNILGIDITYKRVVKAAKKLKNFNIPNAKIAICDARMLFTEIIPDQSLHGVCIFFPDPWPKDKHEKNRLLSIQFIENLLKKLTPNGFLWFKTDHKLYFEETNKLLLNLGFEHDLNNTLQPSSILGGPYETAFQKIFTQKGVPFFQSIYLKSRV